MFLNHQPKEGAEQLSKWARDVLEFHGGIPVPETLTPTEVDEFLTHLSFGGDRFCFAVHFGIVAVAREELGEEDYGELLGFLSESIKRFEGSLTKREHGLLRLIATGVVADDETVSWLENSESIRPEAVLELIRLVVPSQNTEVVRRIADWAIRDQQYDWVRSLVKIHAPNDEDRLCREILAKLPDDQIEDSFLCDLISYGLAKTDPETARLYLPLLSSQYDRARAKRALCQDVAPEVDGEVLTPPERESVLEKNGIQSEDDLLRYESNMLKKYAESKEDPELDYFEVENIAGELCEVLAVYGDFSKLFQHIDKLSPKGCLRDVTDELFHHWKPDEDVPEIFRIAKALKDELNEESDDDTYMMERFLLLLVYQLASKERYPLAIKIADLLLKQFAEPEGRERIATWYLWRGEYEDARSLGGATPNRYWCPNDLQSNFIRGQNDEEAIRYYRSIKDWDQSIEELMHCAWHGRPREALTHLLRYEIRRRIAEWVYDSYYDDREDYPREYETLCLHAKEAARHQIRYNRKDGPRTPPEIRALRVAMLGVIGFINLLVYRNWHGRRGKENEERRDNAKEEVCYRKLNEGLEKGKQEPDRENRVRILCRLPSDLHYVSRSLHDRYIDETSLQVALRTELPKLREAESSIQLHRAADEWGALAVALLESHDLLGAIEAWTEYEKYQSISPDRSESLVKDAQAENWHLVAPFCRSNPLSAAILAAKLKIWFPEIRKQGK